MTHIKKDKNLLDLNSRESRAKTVVRMEGNSQAYYKMSQIRESDEEWEDSQGDQHS